MDSAINNRNPGHEADKPTGSPETVIDAVARAVGSTVGTIIAGATKVLGGPKTGGATNEGVKSKTDPSLQTSVSDKSSANRISAKKWKRKKHKRTLKRSNTKG
jgi:gas vesicle protein